MIETTHRDFRITFDEDSEEWRCRDLEIPTNAKLSAIKRRIDEILKRDRRLNIPALMASRSYGYGDPAKIEEVTVTLLCDPETRYSTRASGRIEHCFAMCGGKRSKLRLDQLYPVSARPELEAWVRFDDQVQAVTKQRDDALAAAGAYDADSIALASKELAAAA